MQQFKHESGIHSDSEVAAALENPVAQGQGIKPDYRGFQLGQIRLQQALVQLENRTCEVLKFVFIYDISRPQYREWY